MEPLQNGNQADTTVPVDGQNNQNGNNARRVDNAVVPPRQNEVDGFQQNGGNNNQVVNPVNPNADANRPRSFTWGNAFNKFVKGFFSPITLMIQNPFETLLVLGIGLLAVSFAPVLIPYMIYAGIGFGVFQLGKGGYGVVQGIRENNGEKIENAFENFGNGTFDILTLGIGKGVLTRGLKLVGKLLKALVQETARWYRTVFFPQLFQLNKPAIACAALNVVEIADVGYSAATLNASGVFVGASAFAATKYVYMGFHYRSYIARAAEILYKSNEVRRAVWQAVKNGTKEFFIQAGYYIFKPSVRMPAGAIAEGATTTELQASIFSRLSQLTRNPQEKTLFEHLARYVTTGSEADRLAIQQLLPQVTAPHLSQIPPHLRGQFLSQLFQQMQGSANNTQLQGFLNSFMQRAAGII